MALRPYIGEHYDHEGNLVLRYRAFTQPGLHRIQARRCSALPIFDDPLATKYRHTYRSRPRWVAMLEGAVAGSAAAHLAIWAFVR